MYYFKWMLPMTNSMSFGTFLCHWARPSRIYVNIEYLISVPMCCVWSDMLHAGRMMMNCWYSAITDVLGFQYKWKGQPKFPQAVLGPSFAQHLAFTEGKSEIAILYKCNDERNWKILFSHSDYSGKNMGIWSHTKRIISNFC